MSPATAAGFAFSPPSSIGGITGTARDVAIGDVNGDFRDDVVVASAWTTAPSAVHVFLQQPDGRLAEPQPYAYPSTTMALADLNNDGTLDIVLGGSGLTLMVANGLGGFSATTVPQPPSTIGSCVGMGVLDVNRDGNVDVACVVDFGYSSLFLGDGKGGIASTAKFITDAVNTVDVKTGDVTGDGYADLIVSTSKWRSIYVHPNNGSAGFGDRSTYGLPDGVIPASIAAGDFNGDGRNDLAVSGNSTIWVLDQDAQGKLGEARPVANGGSLAMDAADLDRNGLTDLFMPSIYSLQDYGTGLRAPSPTGTSGTFGVAAGDLNGDGCGDIATATEGTLSVVHGTGCSIPSPVAKAPQRAPDLDGDGKKDLLWYQPVTRHIYRWLMDGATIRQGIGEVYAPTENSTPRAHEDFNKDGRADIVIADDFDIWMYVARADGTYNQVHMTSYPAGWKILGAGDIDRDGAADLFWYHPGSRQLYFWMMDGPNVLSGRGGMIGPPNTTPVAIDDFDGDGTTDILLANSREIWMYSNTAVGTFNSKRVEAFPFGWQLGGTGDFDGDGKADLLWYHPQTRELYYWLMDGANIRSGRPASRMPEAATPATVGDFNGDGLADVVLPNALDIWMYQGNNLGGFTSKYVAIYPRGTSWTIY